MYQVANLPTVPSLVPWGRGKQGHLVWVLVGWGANVGKANPLSTGPPRRPTLQVTLPGTTLGCTIAKPNQSNCVGGGKSPTTLQRCSGALDPQVG